MQKEEADPEGMKSLRKKQTRILKYKKKIAKKRVACNLHETE